jgi:nucleotide-binding universal stress UspA family protein
MFDKVLVPIDGSQGSLKAARVAAEIARRFDSQVTLLHVEQLTAAILATSSTPGMVGPDAATERALEEAGHRALRKARECMGLPDERVQGEVLPGHPAETICRAAEEGGYDLIVMGSRGLSEVRAFFLGSVSDRVAHHVRCPMLIVR